MDLDYARAVEFDACGVRGCGRPADQTRQAIYVSHRLGAVFKVELLLCDEHAADSSAHPEKYQVTDPADTEVDRVYARSRRG